MTPDKVEAALGVASQMRDELMLAYSHEMAICNVECADEYLHRAQALSVLTEALGESRRDAALGREIATAFLPVMEAMRPLVLNLERLKDAAMQGEPHD